MNINLIRKSKFLTRADVNPPVLVTIQSIEEVNVAMEGASPEMRWALYFDEAEKPMVLNSTNAKIIAAVTGSDETDNWVGRKIVLYDDPNISFGGKLVGGIRCRAPKVRQDTPVPMPAPMPKPMPAPAPVPASTPAPTSQASPPLPGDPEGDEPF